LALKVGFDERDFLLEVDPETFFVTDHIKNWPIVYARPESLDPDFLKENILKVWRAQVSKKTLRAWDAARGELR
jgi:hypothetical protein